MVKVHKIGVVSREGQILWLMEKKVPRKWTMPPLWILFVLLGITAIIACGAGAILISAKLWHPAANVWALGFVAMFFLWFLEHQIRKDFEALYSLRKTNG